MTDQEKIQDLKESLQDLENEYRWIKEENKEKDAQIEVLEVELDSLAEKYNSLEKYKEELTFHIKELLQYAVISDGLAWEGRDAEEKLLALLREGV